MVIQQQDITQIMSATITWMSDVLNPNRDDIFRNSLKTIVNDIGGICDSGAGGDPCPDLPTEGKPQPEKHGNPDANTWKTTKMVGSKYKGQYKVVDDKNINIAVEFKKQANAQQYIDHFKCEQNKPPTPKVTKAIIKPVPEQIPTSGTFTLDGSSSVAAEGTTILTYAWGQTKGELVILPTPVSPTVGITSPSTEQQLEFTLTVTDTLGGSDMTSVSINVSNAVIVTPTPTPLPGGPVDEEGIQKIYQDDPSKATQKFIMIKDGLNSNRILGKGARTKQPDGSWKITPDSGTNPASARIYIQTTNSAGYDIATQIKLGKDWKNMLTFADPDGQKRGGWMVDNFDWRDTELSFYWKIPVLKTDDEMTCYLGGRHPSDDVWPDNCVSSCYKLQIQTKDLSSRAAIEWDHIGGSTNYAWNDTLKDLFSLSNELGGKIDGKLIGMKWIRYNNVVNGVLKSVTMEMYLDLASKDLPKPDLTKQNWRLFTSVTHDGTNWPSKPSDNTRESKCNAVGVTMPAWGAPTVAIRFDESDWIIYALSVRPIITQKL